MKEESLTEKENGISVPFKGTQLQRSSKTFFCCMATSESCIKMRSIFLRELSAIKKEISFLYMENFLLYTQEQNDKISFGGTFISSNLVKDKPQWTENIQKLIHENIKCLISHFLHQKEHATDEYENGKPVQIKLYESALLI